MGGDPSSRREPAQLKGRKADRQRRPKRPPGLALGAQSAGEGPCGSPRGAGRARAARGSPSPVATNPGRLAPPERIPRTPGRAPRAAVPAGCGQAWTPRRSAERRVRDGAAVGQTRTGYQNAHPRHPARPPSPAPALGGARAPRPRLRRAPRGSRGVANGLPEATEERHAAGRAPPPAGAQPPVESRARGPPAGRNRRGMN